MYSLAMLPSPPGFPDCVHEWYAQKTLSEHWSPKPSMQIPTPGGVMIAIKFVGPAAQPFAAASAAIRTSRSWSVRHGFEKLLSRWQLWSAREGNGVVSMIEPPKDELYAMWLVTP